MSSSRPELNSVENLGDGRGGEGVKGGRRRLTGNCQIELSTRGFLHNAITTCSKRREKKTLFTADLDDESPITFEIKVSDIRSYKAIS